MNLYTILIEFEDRAVGIDQYVAESPELALLSFANKAESFEDYDRNKIISIISDRMKQENLLTHVAYEFKGFWIINFGTDLIEVPELSTIFGGYIIQTDKNAPQRPIDS